MQAENHGRCDGPETQDAFERSVLLYARQCPEKREWLLGLIQQVRDWESGRTAVFEAIARYEHWPEMLAVAACCGEVGGRPWVDLGAEERASLVQAEVLRRHAPDKGRDRDLDTFVIRRAELFRRLALLGPWVVLDKASLRLVIEIEITTKYVYSRRRALGLEAR